MIFSLRRRGSFIVATVLEILDNTNVIVKNIDKSYQLPTINRNVVVN